MRDKIRQFDEALADALGRWNIPLSRRQQEQFRCHYDALLRANRQFNLTRITDPGEVAVKHCADSLAVILWVEHQGIPVRTVLDVGTGGGFPAVPLAIMRAEWAVTALDAKRKKVGFLTQTTQAMHLHNLYPTHGHTNHWDSGRVYDLVISRAVGTLATCLRRGRHVVSPNTWLLTFKSTPLSNDELCASRKTAAQLHFREYKPFSYTLDCAGEILHRAVHVHKLLA
ncbi:MAG: 16S rRNA (guanine(527)-N(7))-methyltransferase RsmG [Phycisphaerae bacterium]